MKTADASVITLLNSGLKIRRADLFTIQTPDGSVLRWSSCDRPFTVGANTFALGPMIERSATKQKVGIDVDSITVTIKDSNVNPFLYRGRPIMQCISEGEFDGAYVLVQKLFLAEWADTPYPVDWFLGYVSKPDLDTGEARLIVKSGTGYLDMPMPKALYMPPCNNTFGDAACTKDKVALTLAATTTGASTDRSIVVTGAAAAMATGFYDLGVIRFNGGAWDGISRTVKKWTTGGTALISPALPSAPGSGVSVSFYPSCLKTQGACGTVHSNLPRFRGFPFVPSPDTLYSGSAGTPATGTQGGTGTGPTGTRGSGRLASTYVQ